MRLRRAAAAATLVVKMADLHLDMSGCLLAESARARLKGAGEG